MGTRLRFCRRYPADDSRRLRALMFDKLSTVESQYEDLMTRLGTAEVQSDQAEYRKAAKQLSDLEPLVQKYREYKTVQKDIEGSEEIVRGADADMRELARGGAEGARSEAGSDPRRSADAARPEGSQRREERHSRNPRRDGRRRGGVVRGRPVPHVQPVCRASALEAGSDVEQRKRDRRPQGSDCLDRRDEASTAA